MCAMMNNMAAPVRAVVSTMMIAAVMAAAVMTAAMVTTAVMAAAVVTATAVAAMRHRIRWERQRCRHCGDVS
jgi:hypothetical protein